MKENDSIIKELDELVEEAYKRLYSPLYGVEYCKECKKGVKVIKKLHNTICAECRIVLK